MLPWVYVFCGALCGSNLIQFSASCAAKAVVAEAGLAVLCAAGDAGLMGKRRSQFWPRVARTAHKRKMVMHIDADAPRA